MKNNLKDNTKKYLPIYIILLTLSIIIISYILYMSYNIRNNIQDNNSVIENDNSAIIYEETNTPILYEIASYSTIIYDQDKNRIHNITLACKTLNGYIVTSGSEFSFNTTLGKMDKESGYKKATGFDSNGKKIKMYGGGICQISSTLYNAALIAKLEITERHAHSRRVNYVPKNKDATIYYGGPDFKFINNAKNDITIYASTDGNNVTITLMSDIQEISKPLM